MRAAALESAEAARGQLATAQLQLRKAGLDVAAAAQSIQRLEQDLAVRTLCSVVQYRCFQENFDLSRSGR